MLFSELYKIMVSKVIFAGFRGSDRPNHHLPGATPVNPSSVNVFGDGCPVHQPRDTNVTAVEIRLTEKQENRALKKF